MENYLSILRGILISKGSYFNIYLDGLKDHKFCNEASESGELVQQISSLLTKVDTRSVGICLLGTFIQECPNDIFEKKGNIWISSVLKTFSIRDWHLEAQLIYDVLEKIVKKSQQSPDISKTFASTYLCKIYESLENVSMQNAKYALKCIETCLSVYPSVSGPYRSLIEKFLWRNVISNDAEIVHRCGKCLHLLQQVKGGGVLGINHKTQWKNYQIQLIGGIHAAYNEMFAHCTEIYDDKIEIEKLPWDNFDEVIYDVEPIKKAAQLYTRCHNMIKYLEVALREPFPVEKPILLKKILNIISRGLSVNCVMLEQNPIADNIAMSLLLPKLHVDLLELLTALMSILLGHLRSHTELILGLLLDSLKWTSAKNLKGNEKILQRLRAKVYETLSKWCKIFHSGNRIDTIAEYLFQQILVDITPVQNDFTLKVLSGARKHMTKKARRQLHNIHNEKSNIFQAHANDRNSRNICSENMNQELCLSALRCLKNIILSSSNFLKPTITKSAQIHVTRICAMLAEHPRKPSSYLYSNKNCRKEIYSVLHAILISPHMLCPPPTDIAFAVLRTAFMHDSSVKVRIHCSFILQNLEKLIHPQKESLLFTINDRDVRNTFIKYGQESLMHETVIQIPNEQLSYEDQNFANGDETDNNETNSKNDSQNDANIELCRTRDSDLLPNPLYRPDISIEINEEPLESANLNNINAIDTNKDAEEIKLSSEIEYKNCNLSGDKANKNEEISLTLSEDAQLNSPEFVLRVDVDGENTVDEDIDEPLSKKQKIDEEIELKANKKHIENPEIKCDEDEDTLVADIVSQFVDELN